jgi:cell division protein FtsI/penicillin-binding protein 2
MAYRFATVIAVLVIGYTLLLFHLYELQLVKGDYYLAKADSQVSASLDASANRGAIYFTDKNGNTLPAAVNQSFPIIYAVPKAIVHPGAVAAQLAPILNMSVTTLTKLFSKPNDAYELIRRKADASVAEQISSLNIPGIYADIVPERYYPLASIASQVLGYVGPNASNTGQSGHYGIEGINNTKLGNGSDVTLTIDPNIQSESEKILNDLVTKNGATGGSVIVEDPRTGKILAMAGDPSFDPNHYASSSLSTFLNTNVQLQYEPGSIFKVLTMAAGIDAGKITPQTTYTDYGFLKYGKQSLQNYDFLTHGPYGAGTTMTNVIEHSINTGAIFAENKTGNTIFLNYLKKFGLNDKTGIELPGEVAGNLSSLVPGKTPQIVFDTASYGQGVAITPLELINAIAAIANGGTLMKPYITTDSKPTVIRRVISSSTAQQVTAMMVSAVDHAKIANIEGYSLAGKTGSAFIPDLVHGGYTNKLIDSYIGFGPTAQPQFVALIRLNTLPSTALAAESVVPAFRQLSQYIINYYNIPPDRL